MMSFIYSFFAAVGFSVLFNIPRKEMIFAGVCGGLGWVVHEQMMHTGMSIIFTSFLGALVVGVLSEVFAKIRKMPATVFIAPGIIPLVPGYGLYYAMLSIIEREYDTALQVGFETLMVSTVIAAAVILSSTVGKILRVRRS